MAGARIVPSGTDDAAAHAALAFAGHGMTTMRGGVGGLWQRVTLWRPAAIVFVDHADAAAAAGRPLKETWGHLPGVALSGRPCFLMPAADADPEILDEALNFLRNLAASLPVDRP